RFHPVAADLRQSEAAEAAADEVCRTLGTIDVLINSAGAAQRHAPAELNARAWRDAMDAKFFTYIHMMDAVLPRIVAGASGGIVDVVGRGGRVASPVHLPGGAANAALLLASAGRANAWGHKNTRVSAINPGRTLTGRGQGLLEAGSGSTGKPVDQLRQ